MYGFILWDMAKLAYQVILCQLINRIQNFLICTPSWKSDYAYVFCVSYQHMQMHRTVIFFILLPNYYN